MKLPAAFRPSRALPSRLTDRLSTRLSPDGFRPLRFLPSAGILPLLLLGLVSQAQAQEPAPQGETVLLPPLIVEGKVRPRPWSYVRLGEVEVLSRCEDWITTDFARRHERLQALVRLLIPEDFQTHLSTPGIIILSPEATTPSLARHTVQANEGSRPVEEEPATMPANRMDLSGRFPIAREPRPLLRFMPNLRISESDSYAVFAIIDEGHFDGDKIGLTPESIGFTLNIHAPALPRWLRQGLIQLCDQANYLESEIEFEAFNVDSLEAVLPAVLPNGQCVAAPFSLEEMVDPGKASAFSPDAPGVARARARAAFFIRWCLDPAGGAPSGALWNFVRAQERERSSSSADLFQRSFGHSYAEVQPLLQAYLNRARFHTLLLDGGRMKYPELSKPRLASPEEIARIKGDWERREANYVLSRHPEFVDQYRAEAERSFALALEPEQRSPQVLAALALERLEAGDRKTARALLEQIAHHTSLRPRAYIELARLRYEEALAALQPHERLKLDATNLILRPLAYARRRSPAQADTYVLATDVWRHSVAQLEKEQFSFLEDGLRLFPDNIALYHGVGILRIENNELEAGRVLLERGRALAVSSEQREVFDRLLARLPKEADAQAPKREDLGEE